MRALSVIIIASASLLTSACSADSSSFRPASASDLDGRGGDLQSQPVGIGGGPNKLKRSPCACVKLRNKAGLPERLDAAFTREKA